FTLVQKLSHPLSSTYALCWATWLHQCRREGPLIRERAEAAMTLSTEQGFPMWLAWGRIFRGWVVAEQGQEEEGIVQIHQALAAWRTMGVEVVQPYGLALLAEAYKKAGQAEKGLSVLTEALNAVDKTGARYCEAELYRLKGT